MANPIKDFFEKIFGALHGDVTLGFIADKINAAVGILGRHATLDEAATWASDDANVDELLGEGHEAPAPAETPVTPV